MWKHYNFCKTVPFVIILIHNNHQFQMVIRQNFGNTFYVFVPWVQNNEVNKPYRLKTWLGTIKLLPHTVLLNLGIVCDLGELDSIKDYSKTINFPHLIHATIDSYLQNSPNRCMKHCCAYYHTSHLSTSHSPCIASKIVSTS